MLLTAREKASLTAVRPQINRAEAAAVSAKRKAMQDEICKELAAHEKLVQEISRHTPRKAVPRRLRRCW